MPCNGGGGGGGGVPGIYILRSIYLGVAIANRYPGKVILESDVTSTNHLSRFLSSGLGLGSNVLAACT